MTKLKIIDILNKMADGTLEDGFKFKYNYKEFYYDKKNRDILCKENEDLVTLDECIFILGHLTDEVEVIEDVKEIELFKTEYTMRAMDIEFKDKINELVQAVNELRKKGSDKR